MMRLCKLFLSAFIIMLIMPSLLFSQAMPKKVVTYNEAVLPSDGFVLGNQATGYTSISYAAATNILIGPGYTEDGPGVYLGLAYPLINRLYIVGVGKYGEIAGNPEVDLTARAFYGITSGTSAFNIGALIGLGPLFEKLQTDSAGVYDWVTQFSVAGGIALTYTLSTKFGLCGGYEYQVAGESLGDKTIHRGFLGLNYLI